MKLIIDISHVAHATWSMSTSKQIWRSSIFYSISNYIQMFSPDEVIIAVDSRPTWRNSFYKYYKARKDVSDLKFPEKAELRKELALFVAELKDNFPWKIIQVDACEADDIIAILAKKLSTTDKVTIISKDKDFHQLLTSEIQIYDPRIRSIVTPSKDIEQIKYRHILKGDSADDIPNFFSDDDTFMNSEKKQPALTEKLVESLYAKGFYRTESLEFPPELLKYIDIKIQGDSIEEKKEKVLANLKRNETLISFDKIPPRVATLIINTYTSYSQTAKKENAKQYFYRYGFIDILSRIDILFKEK